MWKKTLFQVSSRSLRRRPCCSPMQKEEKGIQMALGFYYTHKLAVWKAHENLRSLENVPPAHLQNFSFKDVNYLTHLGKSDPHHTMLLKGLHALPRHDSWELPEMVTNHLLGPMGFSLREPKAALATFSAVISVLSTPPWRRRLIVVICAGILSLANKQAVLLLTETLEVKHCVPHECCSVDMLVEDSNERD